MTAARRALAAARPGRRYKRPIIGTAKVVGEMADGDGSGATDDPDDSDAPPGDPDTSAEDEPEDAPTEDAPTEDEQEDAPTEDEQEDAPAEDEQEDAPTEDAPAEDEPDDAPAEDDPAEAALETDLAEDGPDESQTDTALDPEQDESPTAEPDIDPDASRTPPDDAGEAEATDPGDDADDPGDDADDAADETDELLDRPDGRAESGETAEPPADAGIGTADGDVVSDSSPDPSPDPPATGGGPTADEEMPLADHIEEMLRRLLIVMIVVSGVSVLTFPFGEEIINFLWESALPSVNTRPRLYSPLELVVTQIKVASLAGIVVALPVVVYQSYKFMKPGLYPHERRYYLAAVPTSLVLAFVGLVFGYFVMLPTIFTYFTSYSKGVADIAFALGRTFDLILVLLGYLAVIFQIPLFIMLALMMGLVTRRWLADRRLIFWGAFLGISAVFSPDPTGMAPIILTITMILLFEGTLQLAKWTRRGRQRAARTQ